jgi:hypothetical protein
VAPRRPGGAQWVDDTPEKGVPHGYAQDLSGAPNLAAGGQHCGIVKQHRADQTLRQIEHSATTAIVENQDVVDGC